MDELDRLLREDIPAPEMSTARDAAIRNLIISEISAAPERRRRRIRTRVLVWGSVGILALAAAGTGAAVVLQPKTVSQDSVVRCFTSPNRGANGQFQYVTMSVLSATQPQRIVNARSTCAQIWASGALSGRVNATAASNAPGIVPSKLAVCVMPDGSAAVVPGDEQICQAIGLAPLQG